MGFIPGPTRRRRHNPILTGSLHTTPCPSPKLQKKRAFTDVRGMSQCAGTHVLRPEHVAANLPVRLTVHYVRECMMSCKTG